MNKNYPIYKTTFIDDMRSLVEEAAQNFSESTAISYKAVKRVKLRDVEFQKNTSRKITRFSIDKTID